MTTDLPKTCPECGEPLPANAAACACGWGSTRRRRAKHASETQDDGEPRTIRIEFPNGVVVMAHRCAFVDLASAARCERPGSVSRSGGAGPWYCGEHYRAAATPGQFTPEDFAKLKAILVKVRPIADPEAERERAAIRAESGA